MNPRIFIGSSSEGLPIAQQVGKILNSIYNCDCVIWNDGNVFGLNVSYLDSLLKAGSMFDFGILVATKDDKINSRGSKSESPRDNVIFEFGLFMGRLGKFRTLILLEEGAKLPSDMSGVHISKFTRNKNDKVSVSLKSEVEVIQKHIVERYKLPELGFLPSTSIANGFYSNFIERVCDYLRSKDFETIDGVNYNSFEVQVVFPIRLQHNMQNSATDYFKINKFTPFTLRPNDGRDLKVRIATDINQPGKLIICDIPTTLTSIYDSIDMYLGQGFASESKEFELIEAREINNFITVLKIKVNRDPFTKRVVRFIEHNF